VSSRRGILHLQGEVEAVRHEQIEEDRVGGTQYEEQGTGVHVHEIVDLLEVADIATTDQGEKQS